MSQHGFDPSYQEQATQPVQPTASAQSAQPQAPERPRKRRIAPAALLALALVGTGAGGSAFGAYAGARWLAPDPVSSSSTSVVTGQPLSSQSAPTAQSPANVAGEVYRKVGSSVVELQVAGRSQLGPEQYGGGSGFVVDKRGYILTNFHVVDGAREVTVAFSNGQERQARVVGTDRGNDLALLKVDTLPQGVTVATLGDSSKVQIGDTAIAIGSPFGLENTVTQGIISAVDRDWRPGYGRTQQDLLQTDAPINPGNSGGPLFNASGEVIGINTMNESPVRGSVGVGFAVPSNTAKRLLPQLEKGANLRPAWMGISGATIDEEIRRDQNVTAREGVLVLEVVRDSPADRAGLRGGQESRDGLPEGGDIITAINGKQVKSMEELVGELANRKPGDKVQLTVLRDGKERQVTVTLGEWPEQQQRQP